MSVYMPHLVCKILTMLLLNKCVLEDWSGNLMWSHSFSVLSVAQR